MNYSNLNEAFTELLKGERGETGYKGVKGHSGDIGLRGLDGPIGVQGDRGFAGEQGKLGFKGDRGFQGDKGKTGERGDIGPIGFQGPIGDKGPRGYKGPRGDTGITGVRGIKGQDGIQGSTGDSGSQFSNNTANTSGNCIEKKVKDHMDDFLGAVSRSNNFCPDFYGIAGLSTHGWKNNVKQYQRACKKYCSFCKKKCRTRLVKNWGYQYMREYNITCCPAISPNNFNSRGDNLDNYDKYSSIRNYPFHSP